MAPRKPRPLWSDALVRLAHRHFRFLVKDHGFCERHELNAWYAQVFFEGEPFTLSLLHGGREWDFLVEICYRDYPRKNPVALWAMLDALGVRCGPVTTELGVDEKRLGQLVRLAARLVAEHWALLSQQPAPEVFREIKRILARRTRELRRQGL